MHWFQYYQILAVVVGQFFQEISGGIFHSDHHYSRIGRAALTVKNDFDRTTLGLPRLPLGLLEVVSVIVIALFRTVWPAAGSSEFLDVVSVLITSTRGEGLASVAEVLALLDKIEGALCVWVIWPRVCSSFSCCFVFLNFLGRKVGWRAGIGWFNNVEDAVSSEVPYVDLLGDATISSFWDCS